MLDYYFAGRLIAEWDDIFYNDIVPIVFERIVDSISITGLNLDLTSIGKYKGLNRSMRLRLRGTTSSTRRELAEGTVLTLSSSSETVRQLKDYVTLIVDRVRINYSTDFFEGTLFSSYVGDDLLDSTELPAPLSFREKKNPRKEDILIANELIEHLNSNIEFYNKILWRNLDQDRRFMLLDGFNIEVYDSFGSSAGFRSLASIVKNELITIAGNSLVMPVANGYKVGRTYILVDTGDDNQKEVPLFDHYKPLTPVPPYRISVPTRGVFMEAVQGACDACELVKENSSQDWDVFRTEEPTSIAQVVTPTPTISSYQPNYQDFAQPLVNIQNAPDAPAPGAGLAALNQLLGQAGVFNDVTGLQGNQQNAIRTYLSNQENARAFAEMATSLSKQKHNTENADSIQGSINQAKDSGAITDQQHQALTEQHLQQQVDGGENKKAELEKERPSLTNAAVEAV